MPYQRANAVLANFRTGVSKGQFGDLMGTDFKFRLSPSATAARWSTSGGGGGGQAATDQPAGGAVSRTSPMQPPGETGPAGRTGPDTDPAYGPGRSIYAKTPASESPNYDRPEFIRTRTAGSEGGPVTSGGFGFGRDILRNNPNSQGITQGGVKRPLSQARRFGL